MPVRSARKQRKLPGDASVRPLRIHFHLSGGCLLYTSSYLGVKIPVSWAVALTVCLIPTTIGGLLSAIGIAGMDRVTRFNVIAMSGKAVEACGDVDTMILDKTGTITYGNRLAAEFYPVKGVDKADLIDYSVMSSLMDETPEGKSTVCLLYTSRGEWIWE